MKKKIWFIHWLDGPNTWVMSCSDGTLITGANPGELLGKIPRTAGFDKGLELEIREG